MNAAKVYRLSESGSEERGGVSRAHLHLKRHAIKRLAADRAVFDMVKAVLFYTEKFKPNYVTDSSLGP